MVFYRKYRPQKIEELDSKEVRDRLYSVLGGRSISHAFLFTGPKGLGKTSAARIVAKALNCERLAGSTSHVAKKKGKISATSEKRIANSGVEPCNKCEQCKSITNGTNLDILEIDGASNRGIDEIRDLREKVKLSPIASHKKVYIIDEVHMLTQEAFNALLKTLEEPPSHVVFILCTTEPHKVPATILSRCLHIQFKKATEEELVRSFERIIKKELIKADKEALNLIAGLSDGSFRDGVKILEEMAHSASSGQAGRKKITKELIEEKYYVSSIKYYVVKILKCLEEKDTKRGLELVSKLTEQGIDMKFFMEELVSDLHVTLLAKAGIKIYTQRKTELGIADIKHLIELLSGAIGDLKYAVLPQIPLELVIVEWGIQLSSQVRGPVTRFPPVSAPSSILMNDEVRAAGSPSSRATPSFSPKATQQNMTGYSENGALWTALIDKVKAYNHSIAGVLRGCSIKSYDGKSLIIEAKFKFHRDKLNEPRTLEALGKACKEITKKNIKISIILKGGDKL